MNVILAIDGGGSRTRSLLIDRQGHLITQAESGPSNHLLVAGDVVKRSLSKSIDQVFKTSHLNHGDVACVSAGLAGVDFDGAGAFEMETLFHDLGFPSTVVNGDMVIGHAGALRLKPGVVALAGTGSVVLGIGTQGERVKVGGWGPVYGDEGSAYRIGQMSLRAAAKMVDGRGPKTALTEALLGALGLKEFKETISRVYVEEMQPREIAALTPVAYQVAEVGDEVARNIFLCAGKELAESVEAAIRLLKLDQSDVLVSYQGAVLESCSLLRQQFVETLNHDMPKASIVPPAFEPVIGAYLLGCESLGWQVNCEMIEKLNQR